MMSQTYKRLQDSHLLVLHELLLHELPLNKFLFQKLFLLQNSNKVLAAITRHQDPEGTHTTQLATPGVLMSTIPLVTMDHITTGN
jgi:hypothetical protein